MAVIIEYLLTFVFCVAFWEILKRTKVFKNVVARLKSVFKFEK